MFPLRDENPHPPGFKPKLTILLIIINVAVFFYEVAFTGQFWEFSNVRAAELFFDWGAVPTCITGSSSFISLGGGQQIPCPDMPYVSLISSMFLHGGLLVPVLSTGQILLVLHIHLLTPHFKRDRKKSDLSHKISRMVRSGTVSVERAGNVLPSESLG